MSAPEKPVWRTEVAAEVAAESQEAALGQIKKAIESAGGKYLGGGANLKRVKSE